MNNQNVQVTKLINFVNPNLIQVLNNLVTKKRKEKTNHGDPNYSLTGIKKFHGIKKVFVPHRPQNPPPPRRAPALRPYQQQAPPPPAPNPQPPTSISVTLRHPLPARFAIVGPSLCSPYQPPPLLPPFFASV